jgi:hypothetical protein
MHDEEIFRIWEKEKTSANWLIGVEMQTISADIATRSCLQLNLANQPWVYAE